MPHRLATAAATWPWSTPAASSSAYQEHPAAPRRAPLDRSAGPGQEKTGNRPERPPRAASQSSPRKTCSCGNGKAPTRPPYAPFSVLAGETAEGKTHFAFRLHFLVDRVDPHWLRNKCQSPVESS